MDGHLHLLRRHRADRRRPRRRTAGQPLHHHRNAQPAAAVRARSDQRNLAKPRRDCQRGGQQPALQPDGGGAWAERVRRLQRQRNHHQRCRDIERDWRRGRQRVGLGRRRIPARRGRHLRPVPVLDRRRRQCVLSKRRGHTVQLSRRGGGDALRLSSSRPGISRALGERFARDPLQQRRRLTWRLRIGGLARRGPLLVPERRGVRVPHRGGQQRRFRQQRAEAARRA